MNDDDAELEKELQRGVKKIVADFRRARAAVADAVESGVTVRDLRKRAALVIRCQDCGGRIVAHVTWVGRRPLLWAAGGRKPDSLVWVDGDFWGAPAWCRVREYVIEVKDLLPEVPRPPVIAPTVVRVSHKGQRGPMP